jgi:hypothetical protein
MYNKVLPIEFVPLPRGLRRMDGRGLRGLSNSFETEQRLRVFRLPRFILTRIFKIGRVRVERSMKIVSTFTILHLHYYYYFTLLPSWLLGKKVLVYRLLFMVTKGKWHV